MGLEQIEFIIRKDGRVEEKVTGVKGTEVSRKCMGEGVRVCIFSYVHHRFITESRLPLRFGD
jgi:hypothetical protein